MHGCMTLTRIQGQGQGHRGPQDAKMAKVYPLRQYNASNQKAELWYPKTISKFQPDMTRHLQLHVSTLL